MKIERINDNQIRCFLSREDLANRQMKISELAYGTEKARLLFNDMMSFANKTYGFRADDTPLMIEAVPLSADTILLTITKVGYPEDIDRPFGEDGDDFDEDMPFTDMPPYMRSDLPDLPSHISANDVQDSFLDANDDSPKISRFFIFNSLKEIIEVSKIISAPDTLSSSVYKTKDKKYILVLSSLPNTVFCEFSSFCNQLSEYGLMGSVDNSEELKIIEHAKLINAPHALENLSLL